MQRQASKKDARQATERRWVVPQEAITGSADTPIAGLGNPSFSGDHHTRVLESPGVGQASS